MPKFRIRQLETYAEEFEVEADSAEAAIDKVDNMEAESVSGPTYSETTNTYLLDADGVFPAKEQPENATPPK
jgi:cytochrome oxidase Cu insertion factor (SCO1/SenC/PrrC family)